MRKLLSVFLALLVLCAVSVVHAEEKRIQINVTNMNNLVGFATVKKIIEEPDPYVGKRVKITGWYREFKRPGMDEPERSLVFVDFLACCFNDGSITLILLTDDPDAFQFPAVDQQFEAVGTIEKLQDGTDQGALRLENIVLLDHWVEEVYW